MTKDTTWKWQASPHECAVIYGLPAIEAYHDGETSLEVLKTLGRVKFFDFPSVVELNAFIKGIEEAQGVLDALPVDDLKK